MKESGPKKFSVETQQAWQHVGGVLDAFNMLESMMGNVIATYLSPPGERWNFAYDIVLHNTNLDFMKKARFIIAISKVVGGPSFNREHFQTVSITRNALAHGYTLKGARKRSSAETGKEEEFLVLRVMNGKGEIIEKDRKPAMEECVDLIENLIEELALLRPKVVL